MFNRKSMGTSSKRLSSSPLGKSKDADDEFAFDSSNVQEELEKPVDSTKVLTMESQYMSSLKTAEEADCAVVGAGKHISFSKTNPLAAELQNETKMKRTSSKTRMRPSSSPKKPSVTGTSESPLNSPRSSRRKSLFDRLTGR